MGGNGGRTQHRSSPNRSKSLLSQRTFILFIIFNQIIHYLPNTNIFLEFKSLLSSESIYFFRQTPKHTETLLFRVSVQFIRVGTVGEQKKLFVRIPNGITLLKPIKQMLQEIINYILQYYKKEKTFFFCSQRPNTAQKHKLVLKLSPSQQAYWLFIGKILNKEIFFRFCWSNNVSLFFRCFPGQQPIHVSFKVNYFFTKFKIYLIYCFPGSF